MQVNLELWKEARAYGDVQLMPFVDYYSLISYKTVAICIMGVGRLELSAGIHSTVLSCNIYLDL